MTAQIKTKVGLDIGTYSLKIIEVAGLSEKPVLTGIGSKKILGLSGKDISDSIKTIAEESKISAKEVNISVAGPCVMVRFISMPRMNEKDLKSAIKFEAEKFIPVNINDCVIDFQVLGKDPKDNKMNILLAAVKKDYLSGRMRLVENAGFKVVSVNVDSFAVVNAFLKNFQANLGEKTHAILNIGARVTNLSILTGSVINFARDIAVGGDDFNIEKSKPVFNNLIDEVKLSFGYHENQGGKPVDELYVSGGGCLKGLDDAIQEMFGSEPHHWNPLGFLDTATFDTAKFKDYFAVAAGLVAR